MPEMKPGTKELGAWGEAVARAHLENKGFVFIEYGFRSRFGEIDIVMRDKNTVVFIEVKLRKNNKFTQAREFVTYEKQRRIRMTASMWLKVHRSESVCRFDVVEVYAAQGTQTANPKVVHIPEAFT